MEDLADTKSDDSRIAGEGSLHDEVEKKTVVICRNEGRFDGGLGGGERNSDYGEGGAGQRGTAGGFDENSKCSVSNTFTFSSFDTLITPLVRQEYAVSYGNHNQLFSGSPTSQDYGDFE